MLRVLITRCKVALLAGLIVLSSAIPVLAEPGDIAESVVTTITADFNASKVPLLVLFGTLTTFWIILKIIKRGANRVT